MIVNGRLSVGAVRHAIEETTKVTVMLYWLFFGSSALIGVYTLAGGTRLIQDTMTSLPLEPIYIIIMFQIIWIILGCFIDWIGILFLTAPIFVPIAEKLGFDLVWLGALFCLNMQISYISPPFGPAAFYLEGRDAARHHAEPDLRIDLALSDHSGDRARAWSWPFPRSRFGCRARWPAETRAMNNTLDALVDVMRVPVDGDPSVAVVRVGDLATAREIECDVLVVGGGTGGVAAALAAARRGRACISSRKPTGSAAS